MEYIWLVGVIFRSEKTSWASLEDYNKWSKNIETKNELIILQFVYIGCNNNLEKSSNYIPQISLIVK